MEMFELKYFLAVAKFENFQRAAEIVNVSPGSLNKAISRLEDELRIPLFERVGRNIRLTIHGKNLQKRASDIIHREEAARLEISQGTCALNVTIAGPEVILSKVGVQLLLSLSPLFPNSSFEFIEDSEQIALENLFEGKCHLALTSSETLEGQKGRSPELYFHPIHEITFRTFCSVTHPLYRLMKKNGEVPIEKVLEYEFATTGSSFFGKQNPSQSLDGWRDDVFQRKIRFSRVSLSSLDLLLTKGRVLAYLPEYFESEKVKPLKISGCHFKCSKKIVLVARSIQEVSWLKRVEDQISFLS